MLVLLAASPILLFMIALSVFRISSLKAAPAILVYTMLCASIFWKFSPLYLGLAVLEGVAFALWYIGTIVFAAIMLSDLLERTGAAQHIKEAIRSLTPSLPAAAVIVAWGLESFLEAIAGFGSGLVLPITILVAMGLSPFRAAVCALLANSMPTAYGGVGMGMTITANVSGVPLSELFSSLNSILFVPALVLPFLIARTAANSWKEVGKIALVPILAFAGQRIGYLLPAGVPLNSLLGGIFCFVGAVLGAKLSTPKGAPSLPPPPLKTVLLASSSFLLAAIFILISSPLNPIFNRWLRSFSSEVLIYPLGAPLRFNWLNEPGLPLLLAAVLGSVLMGANLKTFTSSIKHVGGKIAGTLVILLSILSLSRVMTYSGMIATVSGFLAQSLGIFYMGLAPLLGAIGAFTTGSITSSAVLMASLNAEMAAALGLNAAKVVASYNAGATSANILTPHALAIVSAVLGTREHEHALMGYLIKFTLGYLAFVTFFSVIYNMM